KVQLWETRVFQATCAQCHNTPVRDAVAHGLHFLGVQVESDPAAAAREARNLWIDFDGSVGSTYRDAVNNSLAGRRKATFRVARPSDVEGVYLKGHGVVYTLTLPPMPQDQPKAPSASKALSDWERARLELRG